jgi:hypothetical protein
MKPPPVPRPVEPSVLIDHRQVARLLDKQVRQIRRWVQEGKWPLPHSVVGLLYFYRRDHVEHYLKTGRWPVGTKYRGMASRPE